MTDYPGQRSDGSDPYGPPSGSGGEGPYGSPSAGGSYPATGSYPPPGQYGPADPASGTYPPAGPPAYGAPSQGYTSFGPPPGYPGDAYQTYGGPPGRRPSRMSVPLLIGAVVLLLVVIGVVIFAVTRPGADDAGASPGIGQEPSVPQSETTTEPSPGPTADPATPTADPPTADPESVTPDDTAAPPPPDPLPTTPAPLADVLSPQGSDLQGGVPVSSALTAGEAAEGTVRVDLYFDYACVYCNQLEDINGVDIRMMLSEGLVTVWYHPVAILDASPMLTGYSGLSANAAATVAHYSPEHFLAAHDALFSLYWNGTNPGPSSTLTNADIKAALTAAGVPQETVDRIDDYEFLPWVQSTTHQFTVDGYQGTPTLEVDDVMFHGWQGAGQLRTEVEDAAA